MPICDQAGREGDYPGIAALHLNAANLLLTTTRSVRRRLVDRPVEPDLVRASLEVAVQAPIAS